MPIQWFPGHMAKARREMTESLRRVDAVLELVDARLPRASRNPLLGQLVGAKPHVIVMTRVDLADPVQTSLWHKKLHSGNSTVVEVDAKTGAGIARIAPALESAAKEKREKDKKRGIRPRPIRTMVVGIPNVGKSSLINRLAGKSAAKTGDRPGVTTALQWIRLGNVELLDTPGVLWPKFDDEETAYALAVSGAIKSEILDTFDICSYFLMFAASRYPKLLEEKYGVVAPEVKPWSGSADGWAYSEPLLREIAIRRGFLLTGGRPDLERCSQTILREVQTGMVGRMSFDWVSDGDR